MTSRLIHIIEDDDSLRQALSRLLLAAGYRVLAYSDANGFLQNYVNLEQGCILLDINLPDLSGMQLHEKLRDIGNRMPLIYLTGEGSIALGVKAIKNGADDFLTKPVEKADLLKAIEQAFLQFQVCDTRFTHLSELRQRLSLLTLREREVLKLLVSGMLNKQIAYQLGNAERTVKAHRHSIMEKMQANSVAELVLMASELDLIDKSRT